MRFFLSTLLLIVFTLLGCKNKYQNEEKSPWTHTKKRLDLVEPVPYCIEKKIRYMMEYNVENDRTGLWRWTMPDGTIYYYIFNEFHGCDDCGNTVYNTECEVVCRVSGLVSGGGDGRCSEDIKNFNFEEEVLIWKSFDF